MIASIILEDRDQRRTISPGDFPLSIGGPGADIPLPGLAAGEPAAWLGISEQDLFVEKGRDAGKRNEAIACNGVPVATSQWLRAGDVLSIGEIRISVEVRDSEIHLTIGVAVRHGLSESPTEDATRVGPGRPPASALPEEVADRIIRPIEFTPLSVRRSASRPQQVRWTTITLAAVVTLLAAVAWFALTARYVVIVIEPEPDRVTLETGWSGVRLGERHLVQQGRYTLTAEKSGYRRLERPIEVSGDRQQLHRFVLEKMPGRLAIDTGEVVGAEVFIDGQSAGVTPLEPLELTPGEHEVRVVAERYAETIERVDIKGAGAMQTLKINLASQAAAIAFTSRPAGAAVHVDGNRLGVTPMTAELLEGRHRIEYRLAGYKPIDDSIVVKAGQPQDLPLTELQPADGTIMLSSRPAGAAVTVNGSYRGETPLELILLPERDHAIRLAKPGHRSESQQIRIASGERREIAMQLKAIVGEVQIDATPADAELFVNGEARGRAVAQLQLPAIEQEIEIRKEGYESYRTTITPRPGFPQEIEVTLVTIEEASAPPARLESPQGQKLILVEGGRFQMGAPRREPGRRANESLREVNLTRPFYISARVVSNAEFRQFRPGHQSGAVSSPILDADPHPVVQITWGDAALYCNWLSEQASLPPAYVQRDGVVTAVRPATGGYRLPLEAEWAWVARYDDGSQPTKYPWGDALPVEPGTGNYADASADDLLGRVISGLDDSFPSTAPVGSFLPNGLGLYNTGGNVAEWVHDIYFIYPSGTTTVEIDPLGPAEGELHVIRGSSWMDSSVSELRLTYRDYGKKARPDVGFRIARYAQ